jgi:hypothetical protein
MRILFTIFVTVLASSTVFAKNYTRIELDNAGQISAFYLKGDTERVCNVEISGGIGYVGQYTVYRQGRAFSSFKSASGTSTANALGAGVQHLLQNDVYGDLISFSESGDPQDVITREAAGTVRIIKSICD